MVWTCIYLQIICSVNILREQQCHKKLYFADCSPSSILNSQTSCKKLFREKSPIKVGEVQPCVLLLETVLFDWSIQINASMMEDDASSLKVEAKIPPVS